MSDLSTKPPFDPSSVGACSEKQAIENPFSQQRMVYSKGDTHPFFRVSPLPEGWTARGKTGLSNSDLVYQGQRALDDGFNVKLHLAGSTTGSFLVHEKTPDSAPLTESRSSSGYFSSCLSCFAGGRDNKYPFPVTMREVNERGI